LVSASSKANHAGASHANRKRTGTSCRLAHTADIESPLRNRAPGDIDFIIVRENNEGEYSALGGIGYEDTPEEVMMQTSLFTRRGVDRVMRYAFELALPSSARDDATTAPLGCIETPSAK
jgi:isocitrate/isopropylmalate dehydrogenase